MRPILNILNLDVSNQLISLASREEFPRKRGNHEITAEFPIN